MEEEWELLELTGRPRASTIHEPSNALVYSLGSILIVWDPHTDRKVNLRSHEGPIEAIAFNSNFEYFASVEKSI